MAAEAETGRGAEGVRKRKAGMLRRVWSPCLLVVFGAACASTGGGSDFGVVAMAQDCPWPEAPQLLQDRPSLPDSTTVVIGGASAKVCYSSPRARNRVIFGELVPYDRLWRTGANEPTMLHLPFAGSVAGVDLEPGTYLLFTIPGRDEWIVTVNTSTAPVAEMLNNNVEVGRGTVRAEALDDHVEALTLRGTTGRNAAELILEWERTRVRIPITRRGGR